MQSIFKFYLLIYFLSLTGYVSGNDEKDSYLKLDKDGIKVYVFKNKYSDFATFRAVTVIHASMDSVLAVLLDNAAYTDWIHNCKQSLVIEKIDFYESYHYQVINIPFPFVDRDIMMHSTLKHDGSTKAFTITTSAVSDYCNEQQSSQCERVKQSPFVRIHQSTGTHKLESVDNGVRITWVQHTDPAGGLPSWLVNNLVVDIPYKTLKNLTHKVKDEKYKYAKLMYGREGEVVALNMPIQKQWVPSSWVKYFVPYSSF